MKARGRCDMHYKQLWRSGVTLEPVPHTERVAPAEQRFLNRVEEIDGCWVWQGNKRPDGYGTFVVNGKRVYVHRWSYEHFTGPIPDGTEIDHLCRNTSCVNPAHLEAVTHRINILRGEAPPAHAARKTHCIRGHEFTPENTYLYVTSTGTVRHCRACVPLRQAEREAA